MQDANTEVAETPDVGYERGLSARTVQMIAIGGAIGTGLFYRLPLHEHPAFRDLPSRALPVSEMLAAEVIALPMHPDLTDEEIDRVVAAVKSAVSRV